MDRAAEMKAQQGVDEMQFQWGHDFSAMDRGGRFSASNAIEKMAIFTRVINFSHSFKMLTDPKCRFR